MGMHLQDSITHLALWLARIPEGKMGLRKGVTLLLPLTGQWSPAWVHRQRSKEGKHKLMGPAVSITS